MMKQRIDASFAEGQFASGGCFNGSEQLVAVHRALEAAATPAVPDAIEVIRVGSL